MFLQYFHHILTHIFLNGWVNHLERYEIGISFFAMLVDGAHDIVVVVATTPPRSVRLSRFFAVLAVVATMLTKQSDKNQRSVEVLKRYYQYVILILLMEAS